MVANHLGANQIIRLIAILLLCTSVAQAEITIQTSQAKSLTGLTGPRVVAGVVLFASDSKPVVTNVAIVKITSPAKFVDVVARRFVLRDGIVQIETATVTELDTRVYLIAGAGSYGVEVVAFDPVIGIDRKSVEIKIAEPEQPIDDGVVLTGVAKESRSAIVSLVQGMASDMQRVADAAKSGQVKTVAEASAASVQLDEATRKLFKANMAKIMQPKLGNDKLDANAPQVFADVAKGFGGVK
jgi:hypothetical protein